MVQLDPTTLHVQSSAVPGWQTETTFQDAMAEQLRHAPWLGLSAFVHVVAFLVLWLLYPAAPRRAPAAHSEVLLDEAIQLVEPERPTPPEPKLEPLDLVVPDLQPTLVTAEADVAADVVSDSPSSDSSPDTSMMNQPLGMGPSTSGSLYGNRSGPGGGGGGSPFRPFKDRGLQWLAQHQDDDGRWDCDGFMKHDDSDPCDGPGNSMHDIGVTGLALLAFLGDNSTMRSGPYKDTVKKGVLWLRGQQDPSSGLFGSSASHDFIYDHAIAAYAMCEAYGLSKYETLRPIAQKALNYLEAHRNPYSVWRYQPRDNEDDTSVTGWCVMAYESGAYFGLDVQKDGLKYAAIFFDQVSDPTGRHGYTKAGERSSRKPGDQASRFPVDKGEAMTAVGLFCRFFMGQDPKEKPVMTAAANLILEHPPVWDEKAGTIDMYYWYYATYALYQMGGRHWTEWQKRLNGAVAKTQLADQARKSTYGSWDPVGAWGEDGGRVYSTAMMTLTLQAYSRYSRLAAR